MTEPTDGAGDHTAEESADQLGDLLRFLDASPSPFHVVRSAIERLTRAGFTQLGLDEQWDVAPTAGVVVRDGALVAWRLGTHDTPDSSMRLVGAHTDSPGLRVKPRPDTGTAGWRQLGVEVYGGVLANSWLDRDLGVSGRLTCADGGTHLVEVSEPVARVPQLAIHLDRAVNEGLVLDRQQHLTPVWGTGPVVPGEFERWIAERAGVDVPVWWELCLHDVQPAAILGSDRSLLASGRLDNQLSCWAAVDALVRTAEPGGASGGAAVAMIVLNDHEEVGSTSTTGAAGPLLEQVIERLVVERGGGRADLLRCLARSTCISADNAHAVHPNYLDRHDPDHRPMVNGGPAIKLNANQRYATSAATAALFRRACEVADVPWQVFVSRNNIPCGSTIGPLTATRLGIDTVDVGVPQLSMHSARELCGVDDPVHLSRALCAYWSV